MFAAQTLVRGSLNVLIVVAAITLLDVGEPGVGYLTSAIGVGGLIGSVVTLSLVGRSRLAVPFGIGIVVWGLPIAVIGTVAGSSSSRSSRSRCSASATAIVDVAGLTLLQRIVPQGVLAGVLGVLEGLTMGAVGIGALVAPLLTDSFGVSTALVATGLLLPLVVLFGLAGPAFARRDGRRRRARASRCCAACRSWRRCRCRRSSISPPSCSRCRSTPADA